MRAPALLNADSQPGAPRALRPVKENRVRGQTASDALLEGLYALGVRDAFGLLGGAIAPLADALFRSKLRVFHCRHEGGAGFAAVEASFATDRPTLLFVTTGPGVTNALTGIAAARAEGAKVVMISGATSAHLRGRGPAQETDVHTMPSGLNSDGVLFHYAVTLEHGAQIPVALQRIAAGFSQPGGFVAHLSFPVSLQNEVIPLGASFEPTHFERMKCDSDQAEACARQLAAAPFVIWAGFGARAAFAEVLQLAERAGAPVICSPRAKGTFPERHPLYLGLSGLGGHDNVERYMGKAAPRHVLVLGTRLGEATCFWSPSLIPSDSFIHVDVDAAAAAVGYPQAKTHFVQAEIRSFLQSVLSVYPSTRAVDFPVPQPLGPAPALAAVEGPVRPQAVFAAVQRVFVDGSDAVVMTESGNAFVWGNHLLRFDQPLRYRVSVGFGSMGHAAAGVVGAALGRRGKAVAVVGDGAMLMASELSTAVQYQAQAVWIVLNDNRYGMVEQGMKALGFNSFQTDIPATDFLLIARAVGAEGIRVDQESELQDAMELARAAEGPFVVDVRIDPTQTAPWMRRIQNLIAQGAEGERGS